MTFKSIYFIGMHIEGWIRPAEFFQIETALVQWRRRKMLSST